MKLAEGEEVVQEFFLRSSGDRGHLATVTNRRLVVTYSNAEESFPLSKVNAVRRVFNRNIKMMVLGAIAVVIGLGSIGSSAIAGLLFVAIGGALLYLGWLGKTQILISQPGGDKAYAASGAAAHLGELVEAVNGRIS